MNKRQLIIASFGVLFFIVLVISSFSSVPVGNFLGRTNTGLYQRTFCIHSGDGTNGGDRSIAGAVAEITFSATSPSGLPSSLDPGGISGFTYNPSVSPSRRNRVGPGNIPVSSPAIGGGSGAFTYTSPQGTQYNGSFSVWRDFHVPYYENLLLREVFVLHTFVDSGPSISSNQCYGISSTPTQSVSTNTWTIQFPGANPSSPSGIGSISGTAKEIP